MQGHKFSSLGVLLYPQVARLRGQAAFSAKAATHKVSCVSLGQRLTLSGIPAVQSCLACLRKHFRGGLEPTVLWV